MKNRVSQEARALEPQQPDYALGVAPAPVLDQDAPSPAGTTEATWATTDLKVPVRKVTLGSRVKSDDHLPNAPSRSDGQSRPRRAHLRRGRDRRRGGLETFVLSARVGAVGRRGRRDAQRRAREPMISGRPAPQPLGLGALKPTGAGLSTGREDLAPR